MRGAGLCGRLLGRGGGEVDGQGRQIRAGKECLSWWQMVCGLFGLVQAGRHREPRAARSNSLRSRVPGHRIKPLYLSLSLDLESGMACLCVGPKAGFCGTGPSPLARSPARVLSRKLIPRNITIPGRHEHSSELLSGLYLKQKSAVGVDGTGRVRRSPFGF